MQHLMTQVFTGPPTITNPPSDQVIIHNTKANLICNAIGGGKITYQWQKLKNGLWRDITKGNKTDYKTSKLKKSNQFRCVVSNEAGKTTSSVTISVLGKLPHIV